MAVTTRFPLIVRETWAITGDTLNPALLKASLREFRVRRAEKFGEGLDSITTTWRSLIGFGFGLVLAGTVVHPWFSWGGAGWAAVDAYVGLLGLLARGILGGLTGGLIEVRLSSLIFLES